MDGVGGSVKRLVWSRVLAGKAVMTDAKSFYTCAKAASSGVEVLHIPASDIQWEKELLDMRWQNCASLPQT